MSLPQNIDVKSLGDPRRFTELGRGGEGRIFEIPGLKDAVYKEFFNFSSTSPDVTSLETLINFRSSWTDSEREWLDCRTVWPRNAVFNGSKLTGFLMPRIPPQFFRKHGVKSNPRMVPCEWNYLSFKNRFQTNMNIFSEVPHINSKQILALLADLSHTLEILHSYDIVVGDISGRNLLWTDKPHLHVLLIDNDSFRFVGTGGIASPKQSPDWDDPFLGNSSTSVDSDNYKIALAAFRGLCSAGTDRPTTQSLGQLKTNGVPIEIIDLILRGVSKDGRPSSHEWTSAVASQEFTSATGLARPQADPLVKDIGNGAPHAPKTVVGGLAGPRPIIPMQHKS